MIFTGRYEHILDSKNRVFIPARLRKGIKDFIVTPGLDGCLYIYPTDIWKNNIQKFEELPLKNKSEERAFKRFFLSVASEVHADNLGRILIPQNLRKEAKIKKKVVIIGLWNRIEIWSKEKWDTYYKKAKNVFNRVGSKLEI
jgi:MraZ protein